MASKTVLITGSAKRVGRSLATFFAKNGWNVAIHFKSSSIDANALASDLCKHGISAEIFNADLSIEASYENLLTDVISKFGALHCLVNNASTFEYDCVDTANRKNWDAHMEVNLRAPFVLSQKFASLQCYGSVGNIINILDQRVLRLTPDYMTYTLSKAGLWTLTQTMALALAPRIRVNALGLGAALNNSHQSQSTFEQQCRSTPLQKGPTLDEISTAVEFIINSPSLTGQIITLDGGQHLGYAFPNQPYFKYG